MIPERAIAKLSAAMLVCLASLVALPAHAEDPATILQKTRDAYLSLKSYADRGTVVVEYGHGSMDTHTFATYFNRAPRHFLLEFHKQGGDQYMIWGDPDAFHTWWKTTDVQYDYPNPNNIPALSLSGLNSGWTSTKIPTLLYGKSALAAAMLTMADPVLDEPEDVDRRQCYRITGRASDTYAATGKEVNLHRVTVWIDRESFLVRRMREEWKTRPGETSRTTTNFEPQPNPKIDEARFRFAPPES